MGVVISTALFALGYLTLIMPAVKETGTLLAGDGCAQYYPMLKAFRRTLLHFFDNIANGSFEFPMADLNSLFGSDTASCIVMYAPFLPYYLLTLLVPEAFVDEMLMGSVIIFMFASGLSFMNMCRYFNKNLLWSGFFAAFYAFCGNAVSTTMWNPHFFVMNIAFPFIIIGIDKILHDKSPLMLTLTVAWVSLGGWIFLVYMIPFAGVFALIRLIYVKKEKLLINIPKYFGIGILSIMIGMLISGIVVVPSLMSLFGSNRPLGGSGLSLWEFFIPSGELINQSFFGSDIRNDTSVSAAIMPIFLYSLISVKIKGEKRCYSLVLVLLMSLPLIAYGLNGFMYEYRRWGFIWAAYICYLGVSEMPNITRTDKRDAVFFAVGVFVFMLFVALNLPVASVVFLAVIGLVNSIGKLREPVYKALNSLYDRLFDNGNTASGRGSHTISALAAAVAAAVMIGASCFFLGLVPLAVGVLGFLLIVMLLCLKRKISVPVLSLMFAAVFIISDRFFANTMTYSVYMLNDMPIYDAMLDNYSEPDMFNRFHNQKNEVMNFTDFKAEQKTGFINNFPQSNMVLGEFDNFKIYSDARENRGLRYAFPDDGGFLSIINPNFSALMYRCGQDVTSMCSTVYYDGFSAKEPLYSLFGINYMYGSLEDPALTGITEIESVGKDLEYIHMYRNNYAFPVGVTYDTRYSAEQFAAFSPAELPFAMMNGVYLEGADNVPSAAPEKIQLDCDYTFKQDISGYTDFGSAVSENRIDIKSDVSGCFLYLTMNGVNAPDKADVYSKEAYAFLDDTRKVKMGVETGNWPWRRGITSYTFSLGYTDTDVNTITFDCDFDFDAETLTLTAVPFGYFENAYRERTRETLKNVVMENNTVSGHIDVTGEKVLSVAIVYNKGWSAYVDGEPAPLYAANGVFLGVRLGEGSHDVKFVYRTPWITEGALVSAGGIVVAAAWLTVMHVLRKKKNKA